jgi:putative ABC transport system permease protein
LIGQGLVLLLRIVPNSPLPEASVPAWAVLLSVGFSVFIGVVFGMFPAVKAARLDPIVALRHE